MRNYSLIKIQQETDENSLLKTARQFLIRSLELRSFLAAIRGMGIFRNICDPLENMSRRISKKVKLS